MDKSNDLWPDLLLEEIDTPISILVRQARLLSAKTGKVVGAEVITGRHQNGKESVGQFQHSFELVAPSLGNYRHELFRIVHPIRPYPLTWIARTGEIQIESETDLVEKLRETLSSPETLSAIRMLYSQSKVKEGRGK